MAAEYQDYDYVEAGTIDAKDLPPLKPQIKKNMRGELSTGLILATIYFAFIFSIPVLNWFFPDIAFKPFWGGMTVTWFLTTVIGMAMAFIIGGLHTYLYERRLKKYVTTTDVKEADEDARNTTIS
ncbi:hypothetical protein [Caryophanon tenue]|uniref:DUF485 domain-containing protein n=1 Tax=Caryophanon tenue TaxID=33978 RepID=A0A1C0YKB7_9BACL|nr:hypothetical protein [Caryophanon tenue]OCS87600.1 hypothetical protein A6M13_09860 [Caryophanon tenue]